MAWSMPSAVSTASALLCMLGTAPVCTRLPACPVEVEGEAGMGGSRGLRPVDPMLCRIRRLDGAQSPRSPRIDHP